MGRERNDSKPCRGFCLPLQMTDAGPKGNILHKAERRDAIGPAIVGGGVGASNLGAEPMPRREVTGHR